MKGFLVIHNDDNVGVALKKLAKGSRISYQSQDIPVLEDIEPGHKIALTDIREEDHVIKYGLPIGNASSDIAKGSHVHLHNLRSDY